jgi:hypothetical protein
LRPVPPPEPQPQGSILAGFLWILALSIVLFWLPVAGPLIAGFVGGRAAGSPGRGVIAAILPAIVMAIIIVIASTLILLPGFGLLAGGALILTTIAQSALVIIGALVGGASAQ